MNYEALAARTMSHEFHNDKVSAPKLACEVGNLARYLEELDGVKKALFYGKALDAGFFAGETHIDDAMLSAIHPERQKAIDILHCVIGIATEAGELLEALYSAMDSGAQLDTVNVAEEVGDVQWYCANLVTALDTTLDAVQQTNIAKLQKRYPEKFTAEAALNRDLDGERKVLEG